MTPYQQAAWTYRQAGWDSVLPLPPGKKYPPPSGFTGADGAVPSGADIAAWCEEPSSGNIALRMPSTVMGLDVDAYAGKEGGDTFQALLDDLGPLPSTWKSGARDGASGIYYFRIPEGTILISALPGIEIIQRHHRYAVVAPSIHPSTGDPYRWTHTGTGEIQDEPPSPEALGSLPGPWLAHLSTHKQPARKAPEIGSSSVLEAFSPGEPCVHVKQATAKAFIDAKDGLSRHDAYGGAVLAVCRAGRNGCPGAGEALGALGKAFIEAISDRAPASVAAGEFGRLVEGACQIVGQDPEGHGCSEDLSWIPQGTESLTEEQRSAWDRQVDLQAQRLELMEQAKAKQRASKASKRPMEIMSAADLLASPDVDESWTVPGLWQGDGRALLVAAAKTGKTTMLVGNLIPCLLDGGSFLGVYPVEPVQGNVLFLNMEVGQGTLKRWVSKTSMSEQAKKRLMMVSLRGNAGALDLLTEDGRARFADTLKQHDIKTVILDPLAPLLAGLGLEENANSDVAAFFAGWSEALSLGGVERDLIAHHAGHDGGRSRGASRLLDEPDAVWTMRKQDVDGQEFRMLKAMGRDVALEESVLTFQEKTGLITMRQESPGEVLYHAKKDACTEVIKQAIELAPPQRGITRHELFNLTPHGIQVDIMEQALDSLIMASGVVVSGQGTQRRYHPPGGSQ